MKISVIMTTHNGRKEMCKRAIESVLSQSFTDFELIIVDDFSQDGTDIMVKSFMDKDSRVSYIRMPSNFGCDTRPKNTGILASKGKYISLIDSDNTYRPDHLSILMREMEKSNVDVVYGDRMIVEEATGNSLGVGIHSDFDPFLLMRRNFIDTSDVLIKRECVFTVGGFDEKVKKFIDWNLWVRLDKYGFKFKRVPQVITNYYVHEDMKSVKNPDMKMTFDPIDCDIVLSYLNKEIKEPRVAIFSLTKDRLEYTKKCFNSMYETAEYPFTHLIIDNGSKDGTKDYLENPDSFAGSIWCNERHFIFNEDNKGISIASNQALDYIRDNIRPDIILKVDNDCFFKTKGWLKKMVEIWKTNRKIAMSCFVEGLKDNPGGSPRLDYGVIKGEDVGLVRHLGGICHFVDARAYDNFRWDEKSRLHGVQDLELSQHLEYSGFTMVYLENYYCEHLNGTEQQHKDYPEYFKQREYERTHSYEKN